jgi:mono/diheme cytochrome c family protein
MPKIYRCLLVVMSVALVWGWSSMTQVVSAAGGDSAKGKSIYQAKCVTCHGANGKGDGPIGKKLKPPARDFTSAESKNKSPEDLQKVIENGVPKTSMVAWGKKLSETEVQDVLAYVLTLRK